MSKHFSAVRLIAPLLLALAFLGLATLYNVATPPGEGPDEPGHFRYVLFLSNTGQLPVQRAYAESDVPGEGHQPPLAYLLALPAVAWLPPDQRTVTLSADPRFLWAGGDGPAAFIRSSQEQWPWQGSMLAWHLARGGSALLGTATLLCTWGVASALARRSRHPAAWAGVPMLATLLVALNPQFLFTSALVTNDALLTTLGAALLWACIAARAPGEQDGLAPRSFAVIAGVLLGLALITKQSALLFVPLVAWTAWRSAGGSFKRTAALLTGIALIVFALAGWWYLRNWQLYGDPLGLTAFRSEFATQPFAWQNPGAWSAALLKLHNSFWASFGWLSLPVPTWINWLYGMLLLAALAGWVRLVYIGGRGSADAWKVINHPAFALLLLPALTFAWMVAFALTAGLVAWQGRLLFPALAAIAVVLARGLVEWTLRLRSGQAGDGGATVQRLLISVLALVAVYVPMGVIAPAYEWRTLAPDVARSLIAEPAYVRYARSWERGVELQGWRLNSPPRPGGILELTLIWHSLEQIPDDWTVFVHLLDSEGMIRAESNSRPQEGAFPMSRWTPGDWVADNHQLILPAELVPGSYRLVVGLYLPQDDDRRQSAWDNQGEFIDDQALIGAIEVR